MDTEYMQKTAFWLLSNIGLFVWANAGAEVAISIQTIEPQVWLQQGDSRSQLFISSHISPGETIITGNSGQVTLQLAEAAIKVNSNAEVTLVKSNRKTAAMPELHVRRGQLCVQFGTRLNNDAEFKLNIGDTMFVAASLSGEICASRFENKSSIELLKGSIQVTHFVDQSLIILSKPGTKFSIEDSGAYQLVVPGVDEPLISESIAIDTPETTADEAIVIEAKSNEAKSYPVIDSLPEPALEKGKPEHIYTVYLFSGSSEESAQNANRMFLDAKYKTQVITSADGGIIRYRVGASGFKSRQAAQSFSSSIVGKLGVKDTWIRKEESDPAIEEIPDPVMEKNNLEQVYTVYLFSGGSEESAQNANRRFLDANYKTQIITSTDGGIIRYRVGVPGFKSYQAAQDFSSSIVGKLGVKDAWIGKQR